MTWSGKTRTVQALHVWGTFYLHWQVLSLRNLYFSVAFVQCSCNEQNSHYNKA